MAAGQLAGGLAWLTISGEDAPDLVATAPVPARFVLRAKIEAVIAVIAVVFAPLVAVLAVASPWHALITGSGIVIAAAVGDRDPVLVPHAGQAQPVPPPAGLVAGRDFCRGVFLDRLGRDRRVAAVSLCSRSRRLLIALAHRSAAPSVISSPRERAA